MRIIAGALKGRVIPAPPGSGTRPTTDALRETIFSTIEHFVDWTSCNVLDLCCGTGAMGFEALSRGAQRVTFVDASRAVCKQVDEFAKDLGVVDRCTVICERLEKVLGGQQGSSPSGSTSPSPLLRPLPSPFDVVFSDPPYDLMLSNRIANALAGKGLLTPGGLLVAEHGEREAMLLDEAWEHLAQKTRGAAVVDIRKLRT